MHGAAPPRTSPLPQPSLPHRALSRPPSPRPPTRRIRAGCLSLPGRASCACCTPPSRATSRSSLTCRPTRVRPAQRLAPAARLRLFLASLAVFAFLQALRRPARSASRPTRAALAQGPPQTPPRAPKTRVHTTRVPPTGILTLASMVLSRLVFQHLGWGVAASVTPAVMGAAGAVFFATTLMGGGFLGAALPEQTAALMVGIGSAAGIVTQVGARARPALFRPLAPLVFARARRRACSSVSSARACLGSPPNASASLSHRHLSNPNPKPRVPPPRARCLPAPPSTPSSTRQRRWWV